jgi:hypothetical protein
MSDSNLLHKFLWVDVKNTVLLPVLYLFNDVFLGMLTEVKEYFDK